MTASTGDRRLDGKTALITGATTGIGFATARRFLDAGAQVVITGQNDDRVAQAAAELGDGALGIRADVRQIADLDRLAAQVEERFGDGLDVLFANAGIGQFTSIAETSEATFDDQFDVNVKGVFFTVQRLLPVLSDGASVILNASAVNAKGGAGAAVYFASKAAVRSFARSMAAELGPERKIRVNSLSPGIVRTAFQGKVTAPAELTEGFVQSVVAGAPLGREGMPADMANAALFLASDESSYITASDLVVDGGWMNV